MKLLKDLNIDDNTLVFFTSDNGTVSLDDGKFALFNSNGPFSGKKGRVTEGGIRVPLVVRWPGSIPVGPGEEAPVIGSDLYPTILEIIGAAPDPNTPLDGVSLYPLLVERQAIESRPLFWHFPAYLEANRGMESPWRTTPAAAIRVGRYKLIEWYEDDRFELYDLEADLGESHDLSEELPDKASELRVLLHRWQDEVAADMPVPVEASSPR